MGFIGTAVKSGIAKKVWNQVRRPKNRAKGKKLIDKVLGKGGGHGGHRR